MKKRSMNTFLKVCCHVIFIVYFVFLIKIVLFKYKGLADTLERLIAGELSGFRSYNIIPFQTIWEFIKLMFGGYFSRGFNNIIGNIFVFAPLGYFLPLLYKRCEKAKTVILAGFFVSLIFELCQYFLYLGSADTDDIILNLTGVILGFLFFKAVERITKEKQTVKYAATVILSIVGFIVAGYLAVDYFGIMFGIGYQKGQVNGNNKLPEAFTENEKFEVSTENIFDDKFDIWGDITSFDSSSVTVNKTHIEDFGDGKGIAVGNAEKPDLRTVRITENTKYTIKDIYDINGSRVEEREATKEDLETDKHINIKGYRLNDELFADEIVINNPLFM